MSLSGKSNRSSRSVGLSQGGRGSSDPRYDPPNSDRADLSNRTPLPPINTHLDLGDDHMNQSKDGGTESPAQHTSRSDGSSGSDESSDPAEWGDMINVETQTDGSWLQDMQKLDNRVRKLKAKLAASGFSTSLEEETDSDDELEAKRLKEMESRQKTEDINTTREASVVLSEASSIPYPSRHDEYGIPLLELDYDNLDEYLEDENMEAILAPDTLPDVGPPSILKYQKESEKVEPSYPEPPLDGRDHPEHVGILEAGYSCEFCHNPIKPFPSAAQQKMQPPEELYCCENYQAFIEYLLSHPIEKEKEKEQKDEKINVAPHPRYKNKAARRLAMEKAEQRMREREARRLGIPVEESIAKQTEITLAPTVDTSKTDTSGTKTDMTAGSKSDATGTKNDGLTAGGGGGGGEAEEREGKTPTRDEKKKDTTRSERAAAPKSRGGGGGGGGSGGQSMGGIPHVAHTPAAGPQFMQYGRQMKTVNYQLSSLKCLEDGWTVKAQEIVKEEALDMFEPVESDHTRHRAYFKCDEQSYHDMVDGIKSEAVMTRAQSSLLKSVRMPLSDSVVSSRLDRYEPNQTTPMPKVQFLDKGGDRPGSRNLAKSKTNELQTHLATSRKPHTLNRLPDGFFSNREVSSSCSKFSSALASTAPSRLASSLGKTSTTLSGLASSLGKTSATPLGLASSLGNSQIPIPIHMVFVGDRMPPELEATPQPSRLRKKKLPSLEAQEVDKPSLKIKKTKSLGRNVRQPSFFKVKTSAREAAGAETLDGEDMLVFKPSSQWFKDGENSVNEPIIKYYDEQQKNVFLTYFEDGTGTVYYPSGRTAISIVPNVPSGLTYLVQEDSSDNRLMAVFDGNGYGYCDFEKGNVRLYMDSVGGLELDKHGAKRRSWLWKEWRERHVHAPPIQPLAAAITHQVGLRVFNQHNISLTFICKNRSARFYVGVKVKPPSSLPSVPKSLADLEREDIASKIQGLLYEWSTLLRLPHYPKIENIPLPPHITSRQQKINRIKEDRLLSSRKPAPRVIVS